MSNRTRPQRRSHQTSLNPDYESQEVNGWTEGKSRHKDMGADQLSKDYSSIAVLLFLYILQGIPLGLAASIPMILSNRKVSYADQAVFSFVSWPFSVKLIWAPIVDSLYFSWMGRRKTWLIPTQLAIGAFMLVLSGTVNSLLDNSNGVEPNIYMLTAVFFALNFLAATQDIAVDGWALTMLSRQNVAYASTCNTVGQTAGYFLGNVVFLALESVDFCNNYLRSEPQSHGMVTLSGFFYFWGIVFMVATTLVWIFKHETNDWPEDEPQMGVMQTYSVLYRIFHLPSIRVFAVVLLTCKIGFAVTDSATGLKLIEAGVHKENLALLAIPMVPLQIILPWIISKYTNGPHPLNVFLRAYPIRLMFGVVFALLLWWTKHVKLATDGSFPAYYYAIILFMYALHQISLYSMFVALMAFHARIADPSIGGTYMTLLNTITNLGGNWPSTLALWLIDPLTRKSCSINDTDCNDSVSAQECSGVGGTCLTIVDGYYVEVVLCIILGLVWFKWGRSRIQALQRKPLTSWKCR